MGEIQNQRIYSGLITYAFPSYRNYAKKLRDAFSELWETLVRSARDSGVGEIVLCS